MDVGISRLASLKHPHQDLYDRIVYFLIRQTASSKALESSIPQVDTIDITDFTLEPKVYNGSRIPARHRKGILGSIKEYRKATLFLGSWLGFSLRRSGGHIWSLWK